MVRCELVTAAVRTCWMAVLLLGLVLVGSLGSSPLEAQQVDFNRHIKPILSDTCYKCHGPDAGQRKADLRLDLKEVALAPGRDPVVIVPGAVNRSELWRRINADDPDVRMPPESADLELSDAERELIGRWIRQGADWQEHWSFVMPGRPLPPTRSPWLNNPIDSFILARIEDAGLAPSPRADRETLVRRVTLDLTGLPPTQQQVDTFLSDTLPAAYGRLVDRLLDSPR